MRCPVLADPDNGMITCSLGSDGTPTEGDVCVYECDDGYVVSGNRHRECQSDETWTGSDATCAKCKMNQFLTCMINYYFFSITYFTQIFLLCPSYRYTVASGDSRPDQQGGPSREQHNYCCLAIV